MERLRDWVRDYAGDGAIAALWIGTGIELAVTSVPFKAAVVPLVVLAAPPLFLRRRFPLAAPAATFVLGVVAATVDAHATKDLNLFFFIALAAMLVFGLAPERRHAIAGLVIALASLTYINFKFGNHPGDYAFITPFFSAVWLVGFILHSRTHQAKEARERADRAEWERELRAQAAVAEERARIARELHDIVGHSVSVMTVQAAAVRRLLREDQQREREALLTVEETGRAALTEMRRLVGVLRRADDAPALVPQPSLEHVAKLVEHAREAGLPTELRIEGRRRRCRRGST